MTEFLDEEPVDRGPIALSMIDAAQKAVGEGDYAEAERLLRQAAAIQETTLGSHPDLATTLNNLAFVCERLNKFDEAERGYRRAHAIAVASLPPGHSLIKTSLSNLVEFCEAHGIPIWTPPAPAADEKPPSANGKVTPPVSAVTPDVVREPMTPGRLPLRMVAAAALLVVAVVVILLASGPKSPAAPQEQRQGTTEASPSVASARTETVPPAPVAPASPKASAAVPPPAPEPTVAPKPRQEPVSANANAPVSVLKAQLCSALDRKGTPDWQCAAASGELPPGRYLFYTRLVTKADTTVEHRWLHGGRVHQSVRLRLTPNPGNGYRTFSGMTISRERAGEWKVELRTADGTLLDQTSFLVR